MASGGFASPQGGAHQPENCEENSGDPKEVKCESCSNKDKYDKENQ
jgi:hypothetical protein